MKASTVEVDVSSVTKKLNRIKKDKGLGLFTSMEAAKLMEPYVPVRTGALRTTTNTAKPFSVTYQQKYAVYQYYGERYDHSHSGNPRAVHHWDRPVQWSRLAKSIEGYIGAKL